jgi:hypothetical protein
MALMALSCVLQWSKLHLPRDVRNPVILLMGLTLMHVLVGTEPQTSATYGGQIRVLLCLVMVGALSAQWSAVVRERALLIALGVAVLSMLYALVQVVAQTPGPLRAIHPDALPWSSRNYRGSSDWLTFSINGLRGTGLVHHVLSFAHVSCVLALTAFSHAVFVRQRRLLWLVLGLAATCGLMVSGARAGLVGWGFGMAILLLLRFVRDYRKRIMGVVLALSLTGAGFVHVVSSPDLRSRIGSFSGRLPIWAHARQAAEQAFPRGMGYGTYPAYAARTYPQNPELKSRVMAWAHNVWLSLAAEAPFAIVGWLLLLVALARRALRQADGDKDGGLGAAVCATLAAWLIIGLFHDSHFQREYFPLILGLWGLCLAPHWFEERH